MSNDYCEWYQESDTALWYGECGIHWRYGSPKDEGMKFCPHCARPIKEANPDDEK